MYTYNYKILTLSYEELQARIASIVVLFRFLFKFDMHISLSLSS